MWENSQVFHMEFQITDVNTLLSKEGVNSPDSLSVCHA